MSTENLTRRTNQLILDLVYLTAQLQASTPVKDKPHNLIEAIRSLLDSLKGQ